MASSDVLYIGIKGTVLALDRVTGVEVWRTSLAGSDFVNVVTLDGELYASARGELFALDAATGAIRWHNKLKGLGWGLVSIASADRAQGVLAREKRRRDEAAAASAGA